MKAKINAKDLEKKLKNLVQYSDGFIQETKASKHKIVQRMSKMSIEAFYEFLDSLARSHPGMLHHVYEWGEVGNPYARLVELKLEMGSSSGVIDYDFLTSESVSENGNTPFFNKAQIMESGVPVTIQEVDAKALFFEVDGEEFFRTGPIVVANPGGELTRGSFLRAFEEFYNTYFEEIFLRAIRFYDHFSNPKEYSNNLKSALNSGNPGSVGRRTALTWIEKMPGDDYFDN